MTDLEYELQVKTRAELEVMKSSVLALMLANITKEPRSDWQGCVDDFERSIGNRPIPSEPASPQVRQYYVDLSTHVERLAKDYADVLRRQLAEVERLHPDAGA